MGNSNGCELADKKIYNKDKDVVFEGVIKNGKPYTGKCTNLVDNNCVYNGVFEDGAFEGVRVKNMNENNRIEEDGHIDLDGKFICGKVTQDNIIYYGDYNDAGKLECDNGTVRYTDKNIVEKGKFVDGEFIYGIKHDFDKNLRYEGEFKDNYFQGKMYSGGKLIFNGSIEDGEFIDGKITGYCKFGVYMNKLFEGLFLEHGKEYKGKFNKYMRLNCDNGTIKYDGIKMCGKFVDGEFVNGKKYYHNYNIICDGEWDNGIFTHGTIKNNGKLVYEGTFINGFPLHGKASNYNLGEKTFTGEFNNNKFIGLCNDNGVIKDGEFDRKSKETIDIVINKGKIIYIDGTIYEGVWLDDEFQGKIYFDKVCVFSGVMVNNLIKNGTVSMMVYNGKKYDGIFCEYAFKGKLFIDDKLVYNGTIKFGPIRFGNGLAGGLKHDGAVYTGKAINGLFEGKKETGNMIYNGKFSKKMVLVKGTITNMDTNNFVTGEWDEEGRLHGKNIVKKEDDGIVEYSKYMHGVCMQSIKIENGYEIEENKDEKIVKMTTYDELMEYDGTLTHYRYVCGSMFPFHGVESYNNVGKYDIVNLREIVIGDNILKCNLNKKWINYVHGCLNEKGSTMKLLESISKIVPNMDALVVNNIIMNKIDEKIFYNHHFGKDCLLELGFTHTGIAQLKTSIGSRFLYL